MQQVHYIIRLLEKLFENVEQHRVYYSRIHSTVAALTREETKCKVILDRLYVHVHTFPRLHYTHFNQFNEKEYTNQLYCEKYSKQMQFAFLYAYVRHMYIRIVSLILGSLYGTTVRYPVHLIQLKHVASVFSVSSTVRCVKLFLKIS